MNQNSISTRVSDSTIEYFDMHYKNKFQGARTCLESFPVLRQEAINKIKGVFDAEELAFIVLAHKGENISGRDLASRRKFESMIADYYEENKDLHLNINFSLVVGRVRELGCMERFVLREICYGIHNNPLINEDAINYLAS